MYGFSRVISVLLVFAERASPGARHQYSRSGPPAIDNLVGKYRAGGALATTRRPGRENQHKGTIAVTLAARYGTRRQGYLSGLQELGAGVLGKGNVLRVPITQDGRGETLTVVV